MRRGGTEEYVINAEGALECVAYSYGGKSIVSESDGYYYFVRYTEGEKVKLAPVENCVSISINGDYVAFQYKEVDTTYSRCFSLAGDELQGAVSIIDAYDEDALILRDDGFYYYVSLKGADIRMAPSANCFDASILWGSFTEFCYEDGEDYYSNFYTLSGVELEGNHRFDVTGQCLLLQTGGSAESLSFAVYGASGERLATFTAANATLLRKLYRQTDTADVYYVAIEGERIESPSTDPDEETWTYKYTMSIHNLNGTLVANVGEVTALNSTVRAGSYGYVVRGDYTPDGNPLYYNINFKPLDHAPTYQDYRAVAYAEDSEGAFYHRCAMPNGTKAYQSRELKDDGSYSVVDANRKPITIGGYTLAVCGKNRFISDRDMIIGNNNSLRRGASDIWWARDSAGKWGAITSAGTVKVPFSFDAYYDAGYSNTDYALVLQGDAWGFVNVNTGKVREWVSSTGGDSEGVESISIGNAKVKASPQVYTGKTLVPVVTVALAGKPLPESAYDVSFPKAVKAGKYLVTVKGKGGYTGAATGVFTVKPKSLAKCTVTGVVAKAYTGKKVKQPKLVVKLGGVKLKRGVDYKVRYSKNKAVGKAKVTVKGKGNYTGKASTTFAIKKVSISKAKLTKIKPQKLKRTGKAVRPRVVLKYKGKMLKAGRDFTCEYKNNKKRGTASIVLVGKGCFKGAKTVSFVIR